MRSNGRNLKRRLQLLGNRLSRAKHYHGYGVHSPFVYSLVRKVLMAKSLFEDTGTAFYDSLRVNGVSEKSARQLHNLLYHIEGQSYSINEVGGDVSVLLDNYPTEKLSMACEEATSEGVTLVVCQPYLNRERQNCIKSLVDNHHSTTVDNRSYIIFFNNKLPKQHYRL